MIKTKIAKLKLISNNNDVNELVRFPAEHSNFLDEYSLIKQKNNLYSKGEDEWTTVSMPSHSKDIITDFFLQNGKTLEVGCGTGSDSIVLKSLGYELSSMDKSSEALKICKEKNYEIKWIEGDFVNYVFSSNFDNIYDKGAFHNIIFKKDKLQFVKSVANNLKKGGKWFSISGCKDSINSHLRFGRIDLIEFLSMVEPYFKTLFISRNEYGAIKGDYSFEAWHVVLEKK